MVTIHVFNHPIHGLFIFLTSNFLTWTSFFYKFDFNYGEVLKPKVALTGSKLLLIICKEIAAVGIKHSPLVMWTVWILPTMLRYIWWMKLKLKLLHTIVVWSKYRWVMSRPKTRHSVTSKFQRWWIEKTVKTVLKR